MKSTLQTSKDLILRVGGNSTQGKRESNQDAFIVKQTSLSELQFKGHVACIADGVSCSDKGQQASHTAVTQFVEDYFSTPDSWGVKQAATTILATINTWLYQQQNEHDLQHNGWLTTFSSVIIKSNTAHVFHVGDSRVSLYRHGKLKSLTKDHQRRGAGQHRYLTRALGMDTTIDVDYQAISLEQGDLLLLTTDGVHEALNSYVLNSELTATKEKTFPLDSIAANLCDLAIKKGSQDNCSCLLIDVVELPDKSPQELLERFEHYPIPPVLTVGQKIDQYRVQRILYSGVRSHVYQVMDENTLERYVLKAPSQQFAEDSDYLCSFIREQWIGEKVNSDRIMIIHPQLSEVSFLYHVCAYLEGITLRQWMFDNPKPSLEQVRTLINGVMKAVRVLQRLHIVHRDLKPENIMIMPTGNVILIDFGAATADGFDEVLPTIENECPLGEINYCAPEYINGEKATHQSDIFSIGVICYELLAKVTLSDNTLPYKQTTQQSLQAKRHQSWDYHSLLFQREELPIWIDEAIKKACHPLPSQRYQSMSEFMADLTVPNPQLLRNKEAQALIDRDPILFWKGLSIILSITVLIELGLLLSS
ncbi:protein kinase domain-containing protein [Aliivibrio salmonicida]|uniref:protein kinase domain-containing protein n=1 Tax=Aliivibrio salmonicida TaxID=40269 RepID=UPI003D0ABC76